MKVILTLNVRGPSYLGLTRSISWLLMPWLLMSPGHQQPWYWLCWIGRFLSYLRKDFNYLRRSMWRNDTKYKYMFMFPLKNLARKGLRASVITHAYHKTEYEDKITNGNATEIYYMIHIHLITTKKTYRVYSYSFAIIFQFWKVTISFGNSE